MSKFKTIEIDLKVYKLIESNRKSFEQTENEILRELLKLGRVVGLNANSGIDLGDNVYLPDGTLLQKKYKGRLFEVSVSAGKIWVNGK